MPGGRNFLIGNTIGLNWGTGLTSGGFKKGAYGMHSGFLRAFLFSTRRKVAKCERCDFISPQGLSLLLFAKCTRTPHPSW